MLLLNLQPGLLLEGNNESARVRRVRKAIRAETVHNLAVSDNRTYYVSDSELLVHNQRPRCIPFSTNFSRGGRLPVGATGAFPSALDWAVKGPHLTVATRRGAVELYFAVDDAGRLVFRGVQGRHTNAAIREATKKVEQWFENRAFRTEVMNKAYNGWEFAAQRAGEFTDPKVQVIFDTVVNLLRTL